MKTKYVFKLLADLGKQAPRPPRKSSVRRKAAEARSARPLILTIDDDPAILEGLTALLAAADFKTMTASSVLEGIKCLQSRPGIALIICDLSMPEQDGYVMLEYVRDNLRFQGIPVIVLSADSKDEAVRRALSLGARDYCAKPFRSETLLAKIRKIFDAGLGRILVVSDDDASIRHLEAALVRVGYMVSAASNGAEALISLSREAVDGIISELALEDMTGLDLLSQAQDRLPRIQGVFIASHLIKISEDDIVGAGGFGLLRKPFNNVDVVHKVAQLISFVAS